MPFRIITVVEGHGETEAVPILIRRFATEQRDPVVPVVAPRSIRISRTKIVKAGELERAVRLAALQLQGNGAVFVVLDADDDCPAQLGPALLARSEAVAHAHGDFPVSVVIAQAEFEAWFLAAALSLRNRRGLTNDLMPPVDPEALRDAKGWLTHNMHGRRRYSEVLDQPALAACMDLAAARASQSFEKFRRDVMLIFDGLLGISGHSE